VKRLVHIQDWDTHVLVTPTYDIAGFRKFVGATLWMTQPQFLHVMQTWAFQKLHARLVRQAVRRFTLCEECLDSATVRCGPWLDYILDEYAKATGITFGRERNKQTNDEARAVLGLKDAVTAETVQRAFRQAVMRAHPDLGGSAEAVRKVVEARDMLLEDLAR